MSRWQPLPDGAGFVDPACAADADPYLLWADVTGLADLKREDDPQPQLVRVLVRLADGCTPKRLQAVLGDGSWITPCYLTMDTVRFCTATFSAADCRRFAGRANDHVEAIELAMPVLPRRAPVRPAWAGPVGEAPLRDAAAARQASSGPVLLGVIDAGCPFAHASFQHAGQPRVLSLWDQDTQPAFGTPDLPGAVPAGFGYGREVLRDDMRRLMQRCSAGGVVDEDLVYERANYPELRRAATHGAAVMDQFIGPRRLRDRLAPQPGDAPSWARYGSRASDTADLVFVQLPRDTWADPNALALSASVLDALHHVLSCRAEGTRRVVVNLSCAVESGPHNGSSLLGLAIQDLVGVMAQAGCQLVVVVPAGNACQARFQLRGPLSPGASGEISLQVAPGCESPTFLQIWLDGDARGLVWTVKPPGDARAQAVTRRRCWLPGPSGWRALAWQSRDTVRGKGTMLLLALAAAPSPDVAGSGGTWQIGLDFTRGRVPLAPLFVRAYVTRNESELGEPLRHRPSHLIGPDYDPDRYLRRRLDDIDDPLREDGLRVRRWGTRSDLAACPAVFVATGVFLRHRPTRWDKSTGQKAPLVPADYSSDGMDGRRSAAAVTEESRALPGIPLAGTRSAGQVRLRGTSFAAPQFARRYADEPLPGAKGPAYGPPPADLLEVPQVLQIRLGKVLILP